MQLKDFTKLKKKLPDKPGVYIFRGSKRKILYIGRATSLKDRVRSYFGDDLIETRGPLLVDMVTKAKTIEAIPTDSILESILLESNLIRKHHPPANTREKDDKSYNYVVITKEDFPRLLLIRGHELAREDQKQYREVFGPFVYGGPFKEALRIIRKIFPYRDTCEPAPELEAEGKVPKPCFNAQIGLCPGVCSGRTSKEEYEKIVRSIILFFKGKKKELIKKLQREMKEYAKSEEFEKAEEIKHQLFGLTHIQDITLLKEEYRRPGNGHSSRIEAYDVAHISGTNSVGVMTVVEDGEMRKNDYRKFKIRNNKKGSDTDALREVLSRRLGHDEWPLPRIIVVDGGSAQKNAAEDELGKYGISIPVLGVVKDERHRPLKVIGDPKLSIDYAKEILLANSEAHRFALKYHRNLRGG